MSKITVSAVEAAGDFLAAALQQVEQARQALIDSVLRDRSSIAELNQEANRLANLPPSRAEAEAKVRDLIERWRPKKIAVAPWSQAYAEALEDLTPIVRAIELDPEAVFQSMMRRSDDFVAARGGWPSEEVLQDRDGRLHEIQLEIAELEERIAANVQAAWQAGIEVPGYARPGRGEINRGPSVTGPGADQ